MVRKCKSRKLGAQRDFFCMGLALAPYKSSVFAVPLGAQEDPLPYSRPTLVVAVATGGQLVDGRSTGRKTSVLPGQLACTRSTGRETSGQLVKKRTCRSTGRKTSGQLVEKRTCTTHHHFYIHRIYFFLCETPPATMALPQSDHVMYILAERSYRSYTSPYQRRTR